MPPDDQPAQDRPPQGGATVRLAPGVRVRADAIQIAAVRSGGPGGQNVNKRSTQVQLRVAVADLPIPADAKQRLAGLVPGGITKDGELLLASSGTRSQAQNRADVLEKLGELVRRALVRPKRRRPTSPTRSSIQRRLTSKKHRSDVKQRRRPPKSEES